MIEIKEKRIISFLKRYEDNGFEAYIVGGAIRDILLGKDINDYDVAVNAHPEKSKELFSDCTIIETGIKHGTITILYNGLSIETTTFRNDGEYVHNRFPSKVSFSNSFYEDASRRDFTVNSMGYSLSKGLVDYYNGQNDLQNKIIDTVGDPNERFNEDALRILRAIRFSSVLDFKISEKTSKAIHENKTLLNNISSERILSELLRILQGDNVRNVISEYNDVLSIVIPGLSVLKASDFDEISTLSFINHEKDDVQRLSSLLYPLAKLSETYLRGSISRLKPSNRLKEGVLEIVRNQDHVYSDADISIKYDLKKYGQRSLLRILDFQSSLAMVRKEKEKLTEIKRIIDKINEIVSANECYSIEQLDIDGKDLIDMGIKEIQIGKTLDIVLDHVIKGKVENKKENLLTYIKERI